MDWSFGIPAWFNINTAGENYGIMTVCLRGVGASYLLLLIDAGDTIGGKMWDAEPPFVSLKKLPS